MYRPSHQSTRRPRNKDLKAWIRDYKIGLYFHRKMFMSRLSLKKFGYQTHPIQKSANWVMNRRNESRDVSFYDRPFVDISLRTSTRWAPDVNNLETFFKSHHREGLYMNGKGFSTNAATRTSQMSGHCEGEIACVPTLLKDRQNA